MKNAIIQIDAAPFKQWYQQHYGIELGNKKGEEVPKVEELKVRVQYSALNMHNMHATCTL